MVCEDKSNEAGNSKSVHDHIIMEKNPDENFKFIGGGLYPPL